MDFMEGKYTFYGRINGRNSPLGEFVISNDEIKFLHELDEHSIGDIFPAGKISHHTSSQINKFLNGYHGYSYLEYDGKVSK
jgi:hypothetical protein